MCKHKSGGMSKPAGAANQQSGLAERTTASYSSQNCPNEANVATVSQVHNSLIRNSDSFYAHHQARSMAAVQMSANGEAALQSRVPEAAHKYPSNDQIPKSGAKQKYQNIPFLPNILHEMNEFSDSQDSDEETEQSPMLMNETHPVYCTPSHGWNPNILGEFDRNTAESKYFNNCDITLGTKPAEEQSDAINFSTTCDKFSYFKIFPMQSNFQSPAPYMLPYNNTVVNSSISHGSTEKYIKPQTLRIDDYENSPNIRKKWLFVNQKCKSADSEPERFGRPVSSICQRAPSFEYNYDEIQMTNFHETPIFAGCTHYLKPHSSTNNDPVAGPSGLQRPNSTNWEIAAKENNDEEFRCRSYSLTPTVNFAVFESESSSEAEDVPDPISVSEPMTDLSIQENAQAKCIDDVYEIPVLSMGKVIPISPSAAQLSIASSYGDNGSPICKICHMTGIENDPLFSPCRCSGTMQYIHCGCLMKWLEVSSSNNNRKKCRKPATCELCQYEYHWHRKFKIKQWQLPQCTRKDKMLHLSFFFSLLLMVASATITVICFKQDKGTKVDPNRTELTQSEVVTLICGVMFFLAFFIAMYSQVKSQSTLCQLLVRFISMNQQWYIDEYEKKETKPVAV